jgi:hypothetical protein
MNDDLKMGDKIRVVTYTDDSVFIKYADDNLLGSMIVDPDDTYNYYNNHAYRVIYVPTKCICKINEPKYIPFTHNDWKDLIGRVLEDGIGVTLIVSTGMEGVWIGDLSNTSFFSYEALLNDYIFADTGEPVGKKVNE